MSLVDRLISRFVDPRGLARLRRSAPAGSVVDLNADLGEGAGHDDELLTLVTSANIACGFHAGDAETMRRSIEIARDRKVAVGAHPSIFDREKFGRKEMQVMADEYFIDVVFLDVYFHAFAGESG